MRFGILHSPSPRSGVDIFGGKKINLHLWVGWVEVRLRSVRLSRKTQLIKAKPKGAKFGVGFRSAQPNLRGDLCQSPSALRSVIERLKKTKLHGRGSFTDIIDKHQPMRKTRPDAVPNRGYSFFMETADKRR